jgi:hypothetical protein
VALAYLLWFIIPTAFFSLCVLKTVFLQEQPAVNTTSSNRSSDNSHVLQSAAITAVILDLFIVVASPLGLGLVISGSRKILRENCRPPKLMWIAIVAILSQLIGFVIVTITNSISFMEQNKSPSTICLIITGGSTHYINYLFIKISTLFLLGTIMNASITKCLNADETAIVSEVKICLQEFLLIASSVGPILFILVAIDSLLVMANSFMIYLTYTSRLYLHSLSFLLADCNGICSLIYICTLCDDCSSAVKALLIPLRSV